MRRPLITLYLIFALMLALAGAAFAKSGGSGGPVYVRGYTRANGTYVAPHMRSAPNGTTADNWSTKGNVNPYTGEPGTKNPNDSLTSTSVGTLPQATSPVPALTAPDGSVTFVSTAAQYKTTSTAPAGEVAALSPNVAQASTPSATGVVAASPPSGAMSADVIAELHRLRLMVEQMDARLRSLENMPVQRTIPAGLAAWRKLQKGMTKEDVRSLLGEPLRASDSRWEYDPTLSYKHYVFFSADHVFAWQE